MKANKNTARLAGALYLVIIIAGIFAEFFVRSALMVPGKATATALNIINSEALFRIGILSDTVMIMSDVALALIFYVLFKKVNQALAMLTAFFRLAQAAVLGFNLLNLFFVLKILQGPGFLSGFNPEQLHGLGMLFLNAHGTGYSIGLIFFAFSILFLAYLIIKSGYLPKVLGILLFIASLGYFIDSTAKILLANYNDYEVLLTVIVFLPAFVAELSLCLWLLFKGADIPHNNTN